jgi:hypothetical protein
VRWPDSLERHPYSIGLNTTLPRNGISQPKQIAAPERIGADSSLIMPMVAPRMANLIIFVKNDESEAGNTVPTSVAPWCGRCSPPVCTGHADQTHGAAAQPLTSRHSWRGVCRRRRHGRHISIFDCYLRAQTGALASGLCSQATHWKCRPGDMVHSSVRPDDYASESEGKFAAEKIIRKLQALLPVSSSSIIAHRPGAPKRRA